MINKSFIKTLLPGLLPIFIFIIADEIWGTKIGLYVAISFGIIELIFRYIKTKKIEYFILGDIGLLLLLGGISIATENEIFFKLKPALIESILVVILSFSIFSPKNIVLEMSKRYIQSGQFNSLQQKTLRKSMLHILCITTFHILLIIYSAFFMSKEAWAFISGGLFYILFLGYFTIEFIRNKRKYTR